MISASSNAARDNEAGKHEHGGNLQVITAAGLVSVLPALLRFGDQAEGWLFRGQAMGLAAVTGMTDFEYCEEDRYRRRGRERQRRAA